MGGCDCEGEKVGFLPLRIYPRRDVSCVEMMTLKLEQ